MISFVVVLILCLCVYYYLFYNTYNNENNNELYFVCVSLPYRVDKYKRVQKCLAKQNIAVDLFYGTNGLELPFELFPPKMISKQYKNHFLKTPNQRGHMGASFAHLGVLRNIIDNNRGRTVVFEDDVIVENDFHQQLHLSLAEMDKIDKNWHILLLGFSCSYKSYKKCHKNDNIIQNGRIVKVNTFMGLWSYVINGTRAAQHILDNVFPLFWHLDHHFARLIEHNKLLVFGVVPSIGFHPGRMSIDSFNYSVFTKYHNYTSDTNT
jgi:GR25 family glycosyltransferase involved in LPS biosynthesis